MLKQRIQTALVLIVLLGLALTLGRPFGFPVFALVMVGVVIGEWLQLLRIARRAAIASAGATMCVLWLVGATSFAPVVSTVVWALAALVWVVLAAGLFAGGGFPAVERWRGVHVLLALLLPGACWFALVAAYRVGLVFLVSIFAIVWAADIAAYFAGRAWGKRKLAPSISPGKTWAGAIGGGVAAVVLALVACTVPGLADSFFAVVARRWSVLAVLVAAVVIVALSVVGDLFESQLKRQRGVKDSGKLLPGHGGVFDRVDALLPIVPIAMLIAVAA